MKVAVENFSECYHCELLHRDVVEGVVDPASYRIRVFQHSQKHVSRARTGEARAYDYDTAGGGEFVAWWLWPNFAFQSYPGGRVHFWKWTPLDVGTTRVTVDWYFPDTELADWEQRLIEHHASLTFAED